VSAIFSACGGYRYRLDRAIGGSGPIVAFLLHNPSTADADTEDATLRRGIGYARAWGSSRLIYINVWAGIATRPKELWAISDPVGPHNDRHIAEAVREVDASGGFIVVAWGVVEAPRERRAHASQRPGGVQDHIRSLGCELRALGRNRDGSPKHPLYVRGETLPRPWPFST
jgi:hypothetical protein